MFAGVCIQILLAASVFCSACTGIPFPPVLFSLRLLFRFVMLPVTWQSSPSAFVTHPKSATGQPRCLSIEIPCQDIDEHFSTNTDCIDHPDQDIRRPLSAAGQPTHDEPVGLNSPFKLAGSLQYPSRTCSATVVFHGFAVLLLPGILLICCASGPQDKILLPVLQAGDAVTACQKAFRHCSSDPRSTADCPDRHC